MSTEDVHGGLVVPSDTRKSYNKKSLFFVIVVENPFFEEEELRLKKESHEPHDEGKTKSSCCGADEVDTTIELSDESLFHGYIGADGVQETHLADDDFLLAPGLTTKASEVPTKFMKTIEMVQRLATRGFDIVPEGMISPYDPAVHVQQGNNFHGLSLNLQNCILSPDHDELYIKIHGTSAQMLDFAERYNVRLRTNLLSFGGGRQMVYSRALENELTKSIAANQALFEEEEKLEKLNAEDLSKTTAVQAKDTDSDSEDEGSEAKASKKNGGFIFEVPDKMRLVERIVREPWEFGGCGLQVYEMRNSGVFVKAFFPMHNKVYQQEYGINKWGTMRALLSLNPWHQSSKSVMSYFGEEVALYFLWLHEMTIFLPYIAIPGVVAALLPQSKAISKSVVNGIFAILCVIWAVSWLARWRRKERDFAVRFAQDDFVQQESVRDEFRVTEDRPVFMKNIYHLKFDVPLTLVRKRTGQYFDRYYSNRTRLLVRYLFSYPLISLLTIAMVVALTAITWWRFENTNNSTVSFAASILSVLTSVFFGVFFDKVVAITNYAENNRTATDEENQIVSKSFFFTFFSFYYSLFVIALYPSPVDDITRLKELEAQMIIITVVKPLVQNAQELLMPYFQTQLRRRVDAFGGMCGAICSMLCCRPVPTETEGLSEREIEGLQLWKEAQREPYTTTSADYLEITLQFGFMSMFAAVFPWAPLAAWFYNTIEIRLDASKLLNFHQRPVAKPANTIGGWNGIFAALTGLSMVTNAYLICHLSPAAVRVGVPDTEKHLWISYVGLQYIFVVAGGIIFAWGSSDTVFVERVAAKHNVLLDEDARRATNMRAKSKALRHEVRQAHLSSSSRSPQSPALMSGAFDKSSGNYVANEDTANEPASA